MPTVRKPPIRTRSLLPHEPRIARIRVDHEALYSAIDRERRRQNLRFIQIAALLDVNPATVCGWGRGAAPRADHLARVLTWLARPLSDFVTTEPAEPRPEAQSDVA